MTKVLTVKFIEALRPPTEKDRQPHPDGLVPSLYLIVWRSGKKSWSYRYRWAGKTANHTLGRYPKLGLSEARQAALAASDLIQRGIDPRAEKQSAKAAGLQAQLAGKDKIKNLLNEYDKRKLAQIKSGRGARRFLDRFVLVEWGERDIQSIKKRDVIELLDAIADSGRLTTANRVRAYLSSFLNWCVSRDVIDLSPALGVKPVAKEKVRTRFLSDDEIRWYWKALDEVGYPFGPFGKMLLLTGGQRKTEVSNMTYAEIDGNVWFLGAERTKNGRPHEVPLSKQALSLLDSLERVGGPSDFVFTTTAVTPISGFSKARNSVHERMERIASEEAGAPVQIEHWTWHDMRRTSETGMARLGVSQDWIDRVVNHISGQHRMVRVYNQHDYANEKRQILDLWGRALEDILAGLDPVAQKAVVA